MFIDWREDNPKDFALINCKTENTLVDYYIVVIPHQRLEHLLQGHGHKKFGPDRLSRFGFIGYKKKTDRQANYLQGESKKSVISGVWCKIVPFFM